jgi:hypothetical protein
MDEEFSRGGADCARKSLVEEDIYIETFKNNPAGGNPDR